MMELDPSIQEPSYEGVPEALPKEPSTLVNPGLDLDLVKNSLAAQESGGHYDAVAQALPNHGGDRALGKYQFMPERLNTLGYQNYASNPISFLKDPQGQENVMDTHLNDLLSKLHDSGIVTDDTPPAVTAGLLWAGHLGGPGAMAQAYKYVQNNGINGIENTGPADANGTTTGQYFKQGYNAYLKGSGATSPMTGMSNGGMFSAPGELANAAGTGPLRAPVSYMDAIKTAWNSANENTISGLTKTVNDNIQNVLDQIKAVQPDSPLYDDIDKARSKFKLAPLSNWGNTDIDHAFDGPSNEKVLQDKFDQLIQQFKEAHPEEKLPIGSYADVLKQSGDQLRAQAQHEADITPRESWTQWAVGKVTGLASYLDDPANILGAMAAGSYTGSSILGTAARQGAAFAGVQTAIETPLEHLRGEMGLNDSLQQSAANIVSAGVGAATISGVSQIAAPWIKAGVKAITNKIFGSASKDAIDSIAKIPGADTSALPVIHDTQEMNPAGKGIEAIQDLSERISKVEEDIKAGQPATTLPSQNIGVRMELPPDEAKGVIDANLAEEGEPLTTRTIISQKMDDTQNAFSTIGDLTPEQLKRTPIPDSNDIPPSKIIEDNKVAALKTPDTTPEEDIKTYNDEVHQQVESRMPLGRPTEPVQSAKEVPGTSVAPEGQRASQEALYANLQEEYNKTASSSEKAALTKQMNYLQTQMETGNQYLSSGIEENKQALSDHQYMLENLQDQLDQAATKGDRAEIGKQMDDLRNRINDIKTSSDQSALQEHVDQLSALQEQYKQAIDVRKVRFELTKAKDQIGQISEAISTQSKQIGQNTANIDDLDKITKTAQDHIDQLQQDVVDSEKLSAGLSQRVGDIQDQIDSYTDKYQDLQRQIEEADENTKGALQQQADTIKADVDDLTKEQKGLAKAQKAADKRTDSIQSTQDELKAKLSDIQDSVNIQKRLTTAENADYLEQQQNKLNDLQDNINNFRKNLNEKDTVPISNADGTIDNVNLADEVKKMDTRTSFLKAMKDCMS